MQFISKDSNNARLAPIFASYSKSNLINIFGLVNIGMMGATLFLLNIRNLIMPGALSSIIACNFMLFLFNIVSIAFLFGKAFEFIREERRLAFINGLLDKSIQREINAELLSRIKSKYLMNFCTLLGFSIFLLDRAGLETIYLDKTFKKQRIVTDINLGLMEKSIKSIKLNQGGISERIGASWHILPGMIVKSKKIEIASVPKSAIDNQIRFLLIKSVKLVPIKPTEACSFANLLSLSKDELIKAIRFGRIATIRMILSQYESCIGGFLSAMDKLAVYPLLEITIGSKESMDWGVIRQMEIDYFDALEEALRSKNIDIIIDLVYHPRNIAWLAMSSCDHPIFRRFIAYYPVIYSRVFYLIEDLSTRNLINESINSGLNGLMNFVMIYLEKESPKVQEIKLYGNFAKNISIIYGRLLKEAMENNDLENFKLFAGSLNSLIDWLGDTPSENLQILDFELKVTVDGQQREDLKQRKIITSELDHIDKCFSLERRLIWLALGGWLAHLTESNKVSLDYHTWANIIDSAFGDLEILYDTYNDDSDISNEVRVEWDRWLSLENIDQSRGNHNVRITQVGFWPIEYYCQRGLELSPDRVEDLPSVMPIGTGKRILGSVVRTIQEFEASEYWMKILKETITDIDKRREAFVEFHKKMSMEEDKVQADIIIESELNTEIIKEFESKVVASWEKKSTLRNLTKAIDQYKESPNAKAIDGIQSIGITCQVLKGAFVRHEQKKIFYDDSGENHGSNLAFVENNYLADTFLKLPKIDINNEQVSQAVNFHLNDLRGKGYDPFILYDRATFYRAIHESCYYKPSQRDSLNLNPSSDSFSIDGLYDDAVLINLRGIFNDIIVIVDLRRFAKLVQYPYQISGDFPLDIAIKPIDETETDRSAKIASQKSADSQIEETADAEQQRRILQQRLILSIHERIQFEDIDTNSGILIRLKSSED